MIFKREENLRNILPDGEYSDKFGDAFFLDGLMTNDKRYKIWKNEHQLFFFLYLKITPTKNCFELVNSSSKWIFYDI